MADDKKLIEAVGTVVVVAGTVVVAAGELIKIVAGRINKS